MTEQRASWPHGPHGPHGPHASPQPPSLAQLESAFQRDPQNNFIALGRAYLQHSRAHDAVTVAVQGLRLAPASTTGRFLLCQSLVMLGSYQQAQSALESLVSEHPAHAHGFRLLGAVLARNGQVDRALSALERCKSLTPHDPTVDEMLAHVRAQWPNHHSQAQPGAASTPPVQSRMAPPTSPLAPPATPPEVRLHANETELVQLPHGPDKILRFLAAERMLHWAIAAPFLVCYLTALALVFYYNPDPSRAHRLLVAWIHRASGLCLIGLPLVVLIANVHRRRVFWENIKEGWIWSLRDVKWLALLPFAALSKRIELPDEGKFNAGEKLNFMWTMVSWPLFAATGIVILMESSLSVLPWLLHFVLAAISTPLILGHMFMAVVNPGSRKGLNGMFSGWVDRSWAAHHYRRWYREKFAQPEAQQQARRTQPARLTRAIDTPPAGAVRSTVAAVLTLVMGAAVVSGGVYLGEPGLASANDMQVAGIVYLAAEAPLWSAPSDEAPPVAGGPIAGGTQLTLLKEAGEYAMVRDQSGRSGYVYSTEILHTEPVPHDK